MAERSLRQSGGPKSAVRTASAPPATTPNIDFARLAAARAFAPPRSASESNLSAKAKSPTLPPRPRIEKPAQTSIGKSKDQGIAFGQKAPTRSTSNPNLSSEPKPQVQVDNGDQPQKSILKKSNPENKPTSARVSFDEARVDVHARKKSLRTPEQQKALEDAMKYFKLPEVEDDSRDDYHKRDTPLQALRAERNGSIINRRKIED